MSEQEVKKPKMFEYSKYAWDFNEEAEFWYNHAETIEECISEAKAEAGFFDRGILPTHVFIGENNYFTPSVDVISLFDQIEEDAYEFAGEIGGGLEITRPQKSGSIIRTV